MTQREQEQFEATLIILLNENEQPSTIIRLLGSACETMAQTTPESAGLLRTKWNECAEFLDQASTSIRL